MISHLKHNLFDPEGNYKALRNNDLLYTSSGFGLVFMRSLHICPSGADRGVLNKIVQIAGEVRFSLMWGLGVME